MNYPTYKKAVNGAGLIVALLCYEANRIIVLQTVASPIREGLEVSVSQVSNEQEMFARIGGAVFDCSPEEYNDTLFITWGFTGSDGYRATRGGNDALTNDTGNTGQLATTAGEPKPSVAGDNGVQDGAASETTGSDGSQDGGSQADPAIRTPSDDSTGTVANSGEAAGSEPTLEAGTDNGLNQAAMEIPVEDQAA